MQETRSTPSNSTSSLASFTSFIDPQTASEAEKCYIPLIKKTRAATKLEQLFSIQRNLAELLKHKHEEKSQKGNVVYRTLNSKNVKTLKQAILEQAKTIINNKTRLAAENISTPSKLWKEEVRSRAPDNKEFTDERMVQLTTIIKEAVKNGYGQLVHTALKGRRFHKALREPQGCCPATTWRLLQNEFNKRPSAALMEFHQLPQSK